MSYKLPLVPQEAKGWLLSRPNYKTKILPFSELCAEYCPFGITMVDCPCADFFPVFNASFSIFSIVIFTFSGYFR